MAVSEIFNEEIIRHDSVHVTLMDGRQEKGFFEFAEHYRTSSDIWLTNVRRTITFGLNDVKTVKATRVVIFEKCSGL